MRVLLVVSVIALAPAAAIADMKPAAQAKFDAGVAQYNAGNYESAITLLEDAYELDPDPGVLFTWAQAERLAGKCSRAMPRYRKFIASKPSNEAIALASNGIQLCEAEAKGIASAPPCTVSKPLPWYKDPIGGAVVVGVVGLGVGIGFFVASSGNRDRADSAQTSAAFNDLLDRATMQRRIGITLTAVGVGLIGGGLTYRYLVNRRSRGPVVGATGTSLFIAGEF